jgi:uncharacterized membrane protein
MTEAFESESGMTTHRIEALTDGIFAFAMTLLVLTLNLPDSGKTLTSTGLHQILLGQADKFFNYALSFVLLAVFWIVHHQQFHSIKRTDGIHLWINILTLMFVALMPFSTTLVGAYSKNWVAESFFDLNMFSIGMLFYFNWAYATAGHRLVDKELDPARIAVAGRRSLVMPAVSLFAVAASFYNPDLSSYAYLLIPFVLLLPFFKY